MPKFRKSVSMDELRANQPEAQRGQNETTYQSSRGGWFPAKNKPVPGTPKKG